MWTGTYDPAGREVWTDVRLTGPLGRRVVRCLVDTGSPVTIFDCGVTDELGYGAHLSKGFVRLWGVGGVLKSYRLDVAGLDAMGVHHGLVEIVCQDLPTEVGVEGLIGMDLLEGRVFTLDGLTGIITLAP